jgi:hypothetical protein
MKKLDVIQMEKVNGGFEDWDCLAGLGIALLVGTGGVIAAASGPIGWLGFAMVSNWVGFGWAAYSC